VPVWTDHLYRTRCQSTRRNRGGFELNGSAAGPHAQLSAPVEFASSEIRTTLTVCKSIPAKKPRR